MATFGQFIQLLLGLVAASGITFALLAYIGKAVLKQVLARDIENHKNTLAKDYEQFKRTLDAVQFEHQTRFSVMQQRRAEVIAEFYRRLSRAEIAVRTGVGLIAEGDRDAQRQAAADAFNNYFQYFSEHRLFLGQAAGAQSEYLATMMSQSLIDFDVIQYRDDEKRMKQWAQAIDRMLGEFPKARSELELSFHKILGITD